MTFVIRAGDGLRVYAGALASFCFTFDGHFGEQPMAISENNRWLLSANFGNAGMPDEETSIEVANRSDHTVEVCWVSWAMDGDEPDNRLQWLHFELAHDVIELYRVETKNDLRRRPKPICYGEGGGNIAFDFCEWAARHNRLYWLEWARAEDPPWLWDEHTCGSAAGEGHLAVLEWVRAQSPPCPWNEWACEWAANSGRSEILQWLRAQIPPCPWGANTFLSAVYHGNLDMLRWLRGQDPPCPWNEHACAQAAQDGRLDILQWLRAQDPPCPWNGRTAWWARAYSHTEVFEWALANGCPDPDA